MSPKYSLSILAGSAFLLFGCNSEKGTGPAAGRGVTGRLFLSNGMPASGAEVKVYPVDHIPGADAAPKTAALSYATRTDAQGRYAIDSLPRGEYNILADKDGQSSYQDSIFIGNAAAAIDPDTLLDAGVMHGAVRLQPNHNHESVTVQALGTNVFANADAAGNFILGPLAQGRYSLRVVTTEDKYTPLFASVTIRTRRADTLADTLRPVFTGIPVVTGIKVAYDTLNGIAHLSWDKVKYPQFQSYEVFRSLVKDLSPSPLPFAIVDDTTFDDPVFAELNLTGDPFQGGVFTIPSVLEYEYRVKVVNASQQVGLAYGFAKLRAPSPDSVSTSLSFDGFNKTAGKAIANDEVSLGDSLRVNLWFSNPNRKIKKAELFSFSEKNTALKTVDFDSPVKDGSISLAYTAGKDPGDETLLARLTDEAGDLWRASWTLHTLADKPVADAGRDTVVHRGGTVMLHGAASDGFGRIAKWEWDIGAKGVFTRTRSGDTSFTLPDSGVIVPCVLRVTDDDGMTASSTVSVQLGLDWKKDASFRLGPGAPTDISGHQVLEFQGKLWSLGGRKLNLPRPATRRGLVLVSADAVAWDTILAADPFPSLTGAQSVVFKNRMWVIGGREESYPDGPIGDAYFTSQETWSSGDGSHWVKSPSASFPPLVNFSVEVFQNKLWAIGGSYTDNYQIINPSLTSVWSSEDGNTWTNMASGSFPPVREAPCTTVFGGKMWMLSGYPGPLGYGQAGDIWSTSNGLNWQKSTLPPSLIPRNSGKLLTYMNRMWLLGGTEDAEYGNSPYPQELGYQGENLLSDVWSSQDGKNWALMSGSDLPFLRTGFAAAVFKDKIILFGGNGVREQSADVWHSQ